MRIDKKMLSNFNKPKDDNAPARKATHAVRHEQSDCAVALFADEGSAADDAADRNKRAEGLEASYDVQPVS